MNEFIKNFKDRLKSKKIKIAVVGLGYVGLPLALEFAKKGQDVLGIEIDKGRLENLKRKKSYITDISDKELRGILNSGNFKAQGDFKLLKSSDVVIICVPTPLKRKYTPNIIYIKQAVKSIAKNLKDKALVILESTTYPGTTEEVILPLLEKAHRKHGRDFFLCFSPERIDPGNADFPVYKIPKVIGGLSKEATELGAAVYGSIIGKVVPVSSARVAEAVKLLENTFRLINIGMIDELAMMANKMKIDIWEVINAAKTKPFGFMPFYPGCGVGGHCIPKDPLYLYWKAKSFGFRSRFIKLASDIINFMPGYVVSRVEDLLKEKGVALEQAKLLVVGVTYKKDVLDLRKSPSIDIINILEKRKVDVDYYDPIVPYLKLADINLSSIKLTKENLSRYDCLIIATDHSEINYKFLLDNSKIIFDTRNVYKGVKHKNVVLL